MSHLKLFVLVIAAAALLPRYGALSIDLSAMINKTVCAIEVRYDENPDRIPRLIKMLTCAEDPQQGCAAHKIGHRHCCHHENKMACVEMRDTVLVFDKKLNATQSIDVSVGCACMIHGNIIAKTPLEENGR